MYGHWYGDGWWMFLTMGVPALIFVIAVLVVVALLVGRPVGRRAGTGRDAAGEILRERFARGEIDEEEYHHRLDALRPGARR